MNYNTSPFWPAACRRMQTFASRPEVQQKEETSLWRDFCHSILRMLLLFQYNRTGKKRKQHCQLDQITSGTMQVNVSLVLHSFENFETEINCMTSW